MLTTNAIDKQNTTLNFLFFHRHNHLIYPAYWNFNVFFLVLTLENSYHEKGLVCSFYYVASNLVLLYATVIVCNKCIIFLVLHSWRLEHHVKDSLKLRQNDFYSHMFVCPTPVQSAVIINEKKFAS